MAGDTEYVVNTNLSPEQLSAVAIEIFSQWVSFAMGLGSIGGKMLAHPTGRYAASIEYQVLGATQISILANTGVAPEGGILESGHARFDLKTKFQKGRVYPMHRGGQAGPATMRGSMWASARRKNSTGFASIGQNSAEDSWILPAMPAYSPARLLADLAAKIGRAGGL
jgi:hypothetical protein